MAAGHLDAEAVVRFAGAPTLLRLIGTLPLAEQRKIADGHPLPVVEMLSDGRISQRMLPAYHLTAQQARVVLTEGRVHVAPETDSPSRRRRLERAVLILGRRDRDEPPRSSALGEDRRGADDAALLLPASAGGPPQRDGG